MIKRALLIAGFSISIALSFVGLQKPAQAQIGNCSTAGECTILYSGLQLQTYWQSDANSSCPGVFIQIDSSRSAFFPPGYLNPLFGLIPGSPNPYLSGAWFTSPLNCDSGHTGVGIESVASGLHLPPGIQLESAVVSYSYPSGSSASQLNTSLLGADPTGTIRLFVSGPTLNPPILGQFGLVQSQGFVIDAVTIWYTEPANSPTPIPTLPAGTIASDTPTPLASVTEVGFPTIPPGPTIVMLSPTTINTVVSGPLATLPPPTNFCSGDPFNPCGTLPYSLVFLPTLVLPSPTPVPTLPTFTPVPLTATPAPTATPTLPGTITNTPVNTPLATIGFGDGFDFLATALSNQFSTLAPLASNGDWTVNGTPVGLAGLSNQLGGDAGQAIGFFTAIQGFQLGTAGNLITILFFILLIALIVEILTLILPILLAIIRFALRAVTALKPF